MPIKVTCSCGRQMMVGDERAGRWVACPKCRARVDVPGERRELPRAEPAPKPSVALSEPLAETVPYSPAPPEPQAAPTAVDVATSPSLVPAPADELDQSYTIETLPDPPTRATPPPAPPPADDLDHSYTIETLPPAPPPVKPVAVEESPNRAELPFPPPKPSRSPVVSAPPAAPLSTRPPPPQVAKPHRPGYQADPEKLTAAYVLSMLVACLGFITILPGAYDVVRHLSNLDSDPIARWAYVVFFLGLMHSAYAIYLGQIPDWSAAWVLTAATLLQAAFYAALLTALFLAGGQSEMVEALDLGQHVDNGRARAWCFVMLCLTGMAAYFCGTVSMRWRRAFVLIREARR